MDRIRVFVGYDPDEAVGFSVCCHSILRNAAHPESIALTPVRGERRDGSNAFIYARFLVPWMCGFEGRAIWLDGDMLVRADVEELAAQLPRDADVAVVQHDYRTKHPVKYLGAKNEDYPRKNWSSVMVMKCDARGWRHMTPETVKAASGAHLHRFEFLRDCRIAALPAEWNHLVGECAPNPDAKIAHFTVGLPCWQPYDTWEFADEWRAERARMLGFKEAA